MNPTNEANNGAGNPYDIKEYQKTLDAFPSDVRQRKEQSIANAFGQLNQKLSNNGGFEFSERQQAILKLKIARHFQKLPEGETVDASTLYDAIIETPKFLDTDKGSLHRLLEVHEQKTLQKVAETRKKLAEKSGDVGFNPYEYLFTTKSGDYCMARLLNMPHLESESAYMRHCVGTSDSYINQIKRADIEILSFRRVPKSNHRGKKPEGDVPIITIEYNIRTKVIEQMKKQDDKYLSPNDPYFNDVVDALKQLRTTKTDAGKLRNFIKISPSELESIKVKDHHVLTENGEVSFRYFNPDAGGFVLKMGKMPIDLGTPRQDVAKIVRIVEGITCQPDEIAQSREQVTPKTKVYIGKETVSFWSPKLVALDCCYLL